MTQHIYDWMLQNITDNSFSAKNIYAGLHLHEFDRETQERLCLLYRSWRGTKEDKKSITAKQAYDLTLAGIDPSDVEPRQTELPCLCGEKATINGAWCEACFPDTGRS